MLCTQRPPPYGLHFVFQQIPGTNSSRASKIDNSQSASVCLMNYLDVHILWEPQTIQEIIFTRHFCNLRKPSNSMAFLLPSWTPLAESKCNIFSCVGGSRYTCSCFTNKLYINNSQTDHNGESLVDSLGASNSIAWKYKFREMGSETKCTRPYDEAWAHYTKRFDPNKYMKFTECFSELTAGTNVSEAKSMISVGVGESVRFSFDISF